MGKLTKTLLIGAAAFGVAAGSYGVAAAASGSGSSSSNSSLSSGASQLVAAAAAAAPNAQNPWGGQRSDETLLTGSTASKVE
jgi:hypothetical protein